MAASFFSLGSRTWTRGGEKGLAQCGRSSNNRQKSMQKTCNIFVVRRPSPRVRTANATQTSMSLRIASNSPSLDVDQLDKCSSLGGHRGTHQLVGRAVTPLRHHQTSSGPVMRSSRQCRWLALALRGDGETQLELMHCGEPRFSAAALLGTALLVRSDAPNAKNLSRSYTSCQVLSLAPLKP